MLYEVCFLFLLFLLYSILGWIMECIACSFTARKLIIDRGFLLGPYCPIYGWGGLCSYLLLTKYSNDPITLFILASVGASVLEYITSYLMEKLFKARWWDYSNRRFNIEGRVCLGNAAIFGILGTIFVCYLNPFIISLFKSISNSTLIVISIICMVIFLVDNIATFTIMTKLKLRISSIKKDSTSDIDKQVKDFLTSYNFFIRRVFRAFPKIKFSLPSGDRIQKKVQDFLSGIEKAKRKNRHKKNKND